MRTRVRLRRQTSKTDAEGERDEEKNGDVASITGPWVFLLQAINVALGKSYSRVSVCLDPTGVRTHLLSVRSKLLVARSFAMLSSFLSLFFLKEERYFGHVRKLPQRKRSCFRRVKAKRLSSVLISGLFP